jgi:hypothetical protein
MSERARDAFTSPKHAALHVPTPGPAVPGWAARSALALGVAVGLGLLTTASGAMTSAPRRAPAVSSHAAQPAEKTVTTLADLSHGAPPGAKLLTASPVHVGKPVPATPTVISGLAANGIPNVALNAYRAAAARMASAEPSCGIGWPLLAGIGRVESNHGQYGGATLLPNGTSTIPIIGEALDGVKWDYITDTDGGRLDGDPVFDHAVGPMQFIPSTWAIYGADADGDGVANPFDINDAALAAARYLCAAGGDLRTAAGQQRAVLAYNHSDEYLALVLATAAAYASGVPVSGPITGVTSGALPPVGGGFLPFLPPVNPGGLYGAPTQHTTAAPPTQHGGAVAQSTGAAATRPTRTGPGTASTGPGTGSTGPGTGSTGSTNSGSTPKPGQTSATPAPSPSASAVPGLPVSPRPPAPVSPIVPSPLCAITSALGTLIQVPCSTPTPTGMPK